LEGGGSVGKAGGVINRREWCAARREFEGLVRGAGEDAEKTVEAWSK
jgi:hypothetical protein